MRKEIVCMMQKNQRFPIGETPVNLQIKVPIALCHQETTTLNYWIEDVNGKKQNGEFLLSNIRDGDYDFSHHAKPSEPAFYPVSKSILSAPKDSYFVIEVT